MVLFVWFLNVLVNYKVMSQTGEIMELHQKLNLITRILKQTVGLKHIFREGVILNIKGKQYFHFSDFR